MVVVVWKLSHVLSEEEIGYTKVRSAFKFWLPGVKVSAVWIPDVNAEHFKLPDEDSVYAMLPYVMMEVLRLPDIGGLAKWEETGE